MIQKNFDDISKTDIDFLVSNEISEIKTLEYKQILPSGSEKDKHEFLADVSSFGNSSGGDIIYGIKEKVIDGKKTGQAEKVLPLTDTTANDAQLRLENMIRTGIEPRLPIQIKTIDGYGQDGKDFVILVRIPQSFASPHMIKSSSRFYCRNSAGKYQLDVQEIRNAFLATDSQAERIRDFLHDRLAKIMADETPSRMFKPYRLVLHLIPLTSFLNQRRIDLTDENSLVSLIKPIATDNYNYNYNFDGFVTCSNDGQTGLCYSYCQIFFDGTIETVNSMILRTATGDYPENAQKGFIPGTYFESIIIEAIKKYSQSYKRLGIEVPVIVSMALLDCKGTHFNTDFYDGISSQSLDRNLALFPNIQIWNFDAEVSKVMKPIFDAVWNAFGYPRSFNYTENGLWKVRQFK
jgi:hypothetical protein